MNRMNHGLLVAAFVMVLALLGSTLARAAAGPDPHLLTEGFLAAHPDLRFRLQGLDELDRGRADFAFNAFKRAARFADKASQAMVADMLWTGVGTPPDRALAYVWMDLAAERGYAVFLGKREQLWAALSEEERERARREGLAIYDEYGDDVARKRLARVLDRERRRITGSRVGFVGSLKVYVPGPAGWMSISGDTYYDDRYWKPEAYFAWQDETWQATPTGVVDVGELITPGNLPEAAPSD